MILNRNIVVRVTDHNGREEYLSTFGTLLSGDIAEESIEITPIQPPERQRTTVSYRISLTFEQDPEGEEALGQMPAPLTVECTILRESGETEVYEFTNAWLDLVENRTIVFRARGMTRQGKRET